MKGTNGFLERRSTHVVLMLLAVCGVFGISLLNGFVWDDRVYVVGRDVYRNFQLGRMFGSLANGVEYLPLRDLTYGIDYLLWGENPMGFHLTSLLLHGAAVIAAFGMTERVVTLLKPETGEGEARVVALLAALAFGLHPIQSQAVNFIICRNVVLSGLFFFAACRLYLSFLADERPRHYVAAVACFVAALLSKATVITLPLVLLLFTLFSAGRSLRRDALRLSPFFLLALLWFFVYRQVAIAASVIQSEAGAPGSTGFVGRLAVAAQIPVFYLKKLLVPTGFSAEYDTPFSRHVADPSVLISVALVVGLGVAAVALRRRRPEVALLIGWFGVTLIPVLNFFGTIPVVADRYAYLPAWAFAFALAVAIRTASGSRPVPFMVAGAAVLVVWSTLSVGRSRIWRTDETLWADALRVSPRQTKAALNLGEAYFRAKDYERAFPLFERAKGGSSANDYYDFYLGVAAAEKGELTLAVNSFKKALEWNEDFMVARFKLAEVYERIGDTVSAIDNYNLVILSSETDTSGLRGKARAGLQRLYPALNPQLDEMRRRVAAAPNDLRARGELALKLDSIGMYDEALEQYAALERLGLKSWQLPYNVANIHKKQRRYSQALAAYERSALLHASAETFNNIGWLHLEMRHYDRAIAALQQAVALDGNHAFAWLNLGRAYAAKGDRASGRRTFGEARQRFPQLAPKIDVYMKDL